MQKVTRVSFDMYVAKRNPGDKSTIWRHAIFFSGKKRIKADDLIAED